MLPKYKVRDISIHMHFKYILIVKKGYERIIRFFLFPSTTTKKELKAVFDLKPFKLH